jgi:hypothetical protein
MLAANGPSASTVGSSTTSVIGVMPNEHLITEPMLTSSPAMSGVSR